MAGKNDRKGMDELSFQAYNNDPRSLCKYGSECYQQNPLHKKKYKHPSQTCKRQSPGPTDTNNRDLKKQKVIDDSTSGPVTTKKDSGVNESKREVISDSESESELDSHIPEKEVGSVRLSRNIIPDSDADSPTALHASTREQISDSDSDSSPVQEPAQVQRSDEHADSKLPESEVQQLKPRQRSLEDTKQIIKQMFLVEMPEDFYNFWLLCKSLSSSNPAGAFRDAGLLLVGPYDVLSGNLTCYEPNKKSLYLTHWRYYYDPPEFQTVIKGDDKTQFHMGYYRDDPANFPCFVASNSAAKDGIIKPMAENMFGAINSFLEFAQRTSNPFQKMKVSRLQKAVQSWANDNKYSLEVNTPSMKNRDRKVVSKTFHRAGIVVPVDRKTELGYRQLIETDSKLKTILKLIVESKNEKERNTYLEKLQPVITAADIANDECDFGTSLELGIDLFSFGGEVLHGSVLRLLTTAYGLLKRPEFQEVVEAHLKKRRKGPALSMIRAV